MRADTNATNSVAIRRRGLMLVLSSPSGAGKSTIARNLLESDPSLELSICVTTRPRRGSEIDGVHYHFMPLRDFERMRDTDALLEWAEVHGNCYGTPREPVGSRNGARPRHAVRHRLARRQAAQREDARRHRLDLHPAALDGGAEIAAAAPRRGFGQDHRDQARQCAQRDRALARIRLCGGQRRSRPRLRCREVDRGRRAPAP